MVEEWIRMFLTQPDNLKRLRRLCAEGKTSFVVDYESLVEHRLQMAQDLILHPEEFLKEADKVLVDITKIPGMHLRVRELNLTVVKIKASHVGKFVQIEGQVNHAYKPKLVVKEPVDDPLHPEFDDYQELEVEGTIVRLYGDLIDANIEKLDPVVITGTVRAEKLPLGSLFTPILVANHIEKK